MKAVAPGTTLTTSHATTQIAARGLAGYIRSTNANGISAHFFRTPVTLSDAMRFYKAVLAAAASERSVCVSSASSNIVFSVRTRNEAATEMATTSHGTKRGREERGPTEAETAPTPLPSPHGSARPRWFSRLAWRGSSKAVVAQATSSASASAPSPSTPSSSSDPSPSIAEKAIAGAKRAAHDSDPRVVLDDEAWVATEHCVATLDRLRSTNGVRIVQQLAVSVNQQRGDLRLFTQCPKIIVLARVAAGLATPLVDVFHAVPTAYRMDGLFSTSGGTATDPIGGALSTRPTEEEATATEHGQPPLCVVIGLASAQRQEPVAVRPRSVW